MKQRWVAATGLAYSEVLRQSKASLVSRLRFALQSLIFLLMDGKLAFLAAAFIASILGLFASELFFSFHLLDMINKSSDLRSVFKAVTQNGREPYTAAVV